LQGLVLAIESKAKQIKAWINENKILFHSPNPIFWIVLLAQNFYH
jgi:hypothetical protein